MSFEDQIWHCSLGEKVFYGDWHKRDPALTFLEMLRIMGEVRREHDEEEMKRYEADCAYYAEEEARLLAEEARRLAEAEEEAMGSPIELPEPAPEQDQELVHWASLEEEPELVEIRRAAAAARDKEEADELFAAIWRFLQAQ